MRTSRQVGGVITNVSRILVSVAYTYAIIKQAAIKVQASERWISDEKIQALEFSSHWVRKLLTRANMRRRKNISDDKNVPSDEGVRIIMNIDQKMYKDFGHNRDTTINMDETAFTYVILSA